MNFEPDAIYGLKKIKNSDVYYIIIIAWLGLFSRLCI